MDNPTLQHIPARMKVQTQQQQLTLTIGFHPDATQIGKQYRTASKRVEISRLSPLFSFIHSPADQSPLADAYISRSPVMLYKQATSKNGETWTLTKQDSSTHLASNDNQDLHTATLSEALLEDGFTFILGGRIVLIVHMSTPASGSKQDELGLIGVSDSLNEVRSLISKVAPLKMPVLIRGESGTGKELIAQAIHSSSQRSSAKLVSMNMGAISKELVNAELFGSVKGAFTGAVSRNGCFLEANDSTLFLDEIGEAPLEVQVALLRALETGVIQPVGSQKEIPLNVRIVASTDANLEALIGQESFRMPLLQRLSGLVIEILPLRKRREDTCCLLLHFLMVSLKETGQLNKLLHCQCDSIYYWAWFFAQCSALDWPGNVRQLKNVVTQLSVALMSAEDVSCFDWQAFVETITEQSHIAQEARDQSLRNEMLTNDSNSLASNKHNSHTKDDKRKPRNISEEEVIEALETYHWQIKLAANALNISRTALYQKIDASRTLRRASDIPIKDLKAAYSKCAGNLDKMVYELKISKQALKRRLHEIGLST